MTIGVDTDYFLPADREPKNYKKLPDHVLEAVEAARAQLTECVDPDRLNDIVKNANDAFRKESLLGVTSVLQSEGSFVTSRGMKYVEDGMQETDVRHIVTADPSEGVFVGCDIASLNGMTPELVYVVELPMITKSKDASEALRSRTVIAPVDASTLLVNVDVEGIGEALTLLRALGDEYIDTRLNYLDELKRANDEVDADFLREMAFVTTEILARPKVANSRSLRNAVTELFTSVLDGSTWYSFEGFALDKAELDGHISLGIHEIEGKGYIDEIVTVRDFTYTPASADTPADATFAKTLQPAALLRHGEDEYTIPLKFLTMFYIEKFSPITESCQDSRARFLEEYPDVFNPAQHKVRRVIRNIIERYFKNNERGV